MTRRVKTHIRLGIRLVSPSDQSPRCPYEEILGPYLPIAKFRGVFPRNVAQFLREMSRSFSANFSGVSPRNFAEKTLGEKVIFIFLRENIYFAQGVFLGETRKKSFFLGLICMYYIYPTQKETHTVKLFKFSDRP